MKKLPLLIAAVVLSGCADQKVIEKVGFTRTISFEKAEDDEDGRVKISNSLPKTNQRESVFYSTEAKSMRQARLIFDRQNDRRIVNGQLRQVLFGASLAQEGIWKHFDSLLRDPSVGNRVHVLVADGDVAQLLNKTYPQGATAGEYIDNLIRTETKVMDVPDTNLYTFARDYYDDGIEPVATILKETPNSITIDGIALFRGDRYVARIPPEDKMYFGLLLGGVRSGDLFMDFPDEQYSSELSTLLYFASRRDVKVTRTGPILEGLGLKVDLRLKIRGSMLEYSGDLRLERPEDQRKLEAEAARYVQGKCQSIIATMQEAKADGIGIGQYVRNTMSYREWRKLDWPEAFSRAKIDVHVEISIKDFGKIQ